MFIFFNLIILANYHENITYYQTFSEVCIPEAAAMLNQEANLTDKNQSLIVFIVIFFDYRTRLDEF